MSRYPVFSDYAGGWLPIETCPCADNICVMWDSDAGYPAVMDADHDSDPAWWRERGYTHWMPLPEPPK